jgi:hypothetical protein
MKPDQAHTSFLKQMENDGREEEGGKNGKPEDFNLVACNNRSS